MISYMANWQPTSCQCKVSYSSITVTIQTRMLTKSIFLTLLGTLQNKISPFIYAFIQQTSSQDLKHTYLTKYRRRTLIVYCKVLSIFSVFMNYITSVNIPVKIFLVQELAWWYYKLTWVLQHWHFMWVPTDVPVAVLLIRFRLWPG